MSTDYHLLKKVPACDLFDGRLEGFGVREHVKPDGHRAVRRQASVRSRSHAAWLLAVMPMLHISDKNEACFAFAAVKAWGKLGSICCSAN